MINKSKCRECGLVNPIGDLACRRCGGMLGVPVRESLTEKKANSPLHLLLVLLLLVALGLGFTTDKKFTPEDLRVVTKPRDYYDNLPPERREAARRVIQRPVLFYGPPHKLEESPEAKAEREKSKKRLEQYQEALFRYENRMGPRFPPTTVR